MPLPAMPRRPMPASDKNVMTITTFEPPPLHHSVVSRRRDQDANGIGRAMNEEEQRPALPSRPSAMPEHSKSKSMQTSMMPPPPPRASTDRTRPVVTSTESIGYATPPKRVFSTPTQGQLRPPARSHGRSMTVDRTSDKTPLEFRTPVTTTLPRIEARAQLDFPSSTVVEVAQPNLGDHPDSSHSNRRPPHFKQGAREIPIKYDTRVLDVCGEFICTSGHITRVWSALTGDCIMTLAHVEGIKIVSVIFKPASDVEEEGFRLWLGNNIGEITEADINTAVVGLSRSGPHTRREVIKLYRHLNEIWSLDDGGNLNVWGPDEKGVLSLSNSPQPFRVQKGHTFSMVVVDELWHATGKEIRVYVPTVDCSAQYQVLQRPLSQQSAGDITSGTTISSQPDRVYFGHVDGKVSVYSRKDYTCLGVTSISMYRITTLAGVCGNLWAGFSTGMVYVYDTTQKPWVVKKDWHAHHDPVTKLVADPSSCWTLERTQVVSLGQDNTLRIWDGMLQDDWIGMAGFVVQFDILT